MWRVSTKWMLIFCLKLSFHLLVNQIVICSEAFQHRCLELISALFCFHTLASLCVIKQKRHLLFSYLGFRKKKAFFFCTETLRCTNFFSSENWWLLLKVFLKGAIRLKEKPMSEFCEWKNELSKMTDGAVFLLLID